FKGFATPHSTPIALCEPTAHSTGTPLLDSTCWTSKPGNSSPPQALADYIGAIVTTSVAKSGSTIYRNVAATVVLQVSARPPCAPDPGHPGWGRLGGVRGVGGGLSRKAAARRGGPAFGPPSAPKPPASKLQSTTLPAVSAGSRQFFIYTPELNLLA